MLKHGFLYLFLSISSWGYAGFVIQKGETVTTTQTLTAVGDTGIVEVGGTIAVTGGDGVDMDGASESLFNYGSIAGSTAGVNVSAGGTGALIQNFGSIASSTGNTIQTSASSTSIQNYGSLAASNYGIFITNVDALAQNFGTITSGTSGISNSNNGAVIQNFGTITGVNADGGIASNSSLNITIENAGTIISTVGNGIYSLASFSNIVNQGIVESPTMIGIYNGGGNNTDVENYGTVYGLEVGIFQNANNSVVTNGGTVISPTLAFQFTATNQTLVLLQGSTIQGPVTAGTPLNLTVESGLNLLLTLGSGTFGTLDIQNPYLLVGSTIAVLDPTEFAMQADIAADISDAILNGIYRHRGDFPYRIPCGWSSDLWVEGLGSYRKRTQPHLTRYFYEQGGFLAGYDIGTPDGHFSAFGGVLVGKGELDPKTQNLNTATAFGGGYYERQSKSRFFALSCAGGFTRLRNRRQVAYNLAPGGIETAYSTLFAPFVTPEITYSHFLPDCWIFPDCWISPTITGTARYVALFARGYTESGSVADLRVSHRILQLMTLRGVVGFPVCGWERKVEPFFGGGGRFQFGGNDITATLLGGELFFNARAPRNLGYVIAGFALSSPFGPFLLNFSGEVNADNYHSYRFLAEGSLGLSF